jgi:hypothetical protein
MTISIHASAAGKLAAALKDNTRRYELQVRGDGWNGIGLAADLSLLFRLAKAIEERGKDTRIVDWINGITVKQE